MLKMSVSIIVAVFLTPVPKFGNDRPTFFASKFLRLFSEKKRKTIEFWSRNFSPEVSDGAESNDIKIIKTASDFEKLWKWKFIIDFEKIQTFCSVQTCFKHFVLTFKNLNRF